MSGCSDEDEISFSETDRHGYEGGTDDDDDSEIGKNDYRRRRRRNRMASGFGKVVVRQFTKAKKQIRGVRSRKSLLSKSEESKGKGIVEGGRKSGCKFCFSRPKVLESPNEEYPTSDPNDPSFTHSMLRTLLDKNDFYSKDCNPHLD